MTHEILESLLPIDPKKYIKPFDGDSFFLICGDQGSGGEPPGDPTSTNIISGTVTKIGIPFEIKVVAVSVELEPEVLGYAYSDPVTGDYSIDVYPWTEEVLVYAAPDYGRIFQINQGLATGARIHPTIPNRYVYVALNDGITGDPEPNWPTEGDITSGTVTFTTVPLYRPLMNGYIKPTITPI